MSNKVYISASIQAHNVGVGQYGTEQDRMMLFSDRVKYWLETQNDTQAKLNNAQFEVFRNQKGWTLKQTVDDCNSKGCALYIENHTNAGPDTAEGTVVFYYGAGGTGSDSYKIANLIYQEIAPLSEGIDRGVKPDTSAYAEGLYVVQNTNPPACLVESIFHTNLKEVIDFIATMDAFAIGEAKAICKFFGKEFKMPSPSVPGVVNTIPPEGLNITKLNGGGWIERVDKGNDQRIILHFSRTEYWSFSKDGHLSFTDASGTTMVR